MLALHVSRRAGFFPGLRPHVAKRAMSRTIYGNNCPLVLSPRQLADLKTNESKVVILDASWHMPNAPRNAKEEFAKRRLPAARYLDLDEVASPHELGLMHMMPPPEVFARACGTQLAFG